MKRPTGILQEEKCWFAMRATYGRTLKAREFLSEKGIKTFVPMRYAAEVTGMRSVKKLVPVMPNIIFVYTEPNVIKEVKKKADYLQYITNGRTGDKITVPIKDMERFIAACGTYDEHLLWLHENDINIEKGKSVRITGGIFKGQEGILMKVKGARDKRVVVIIKGVMAVALASIHPSLIELI